MFSKEESRVLRHQFWTSFGKSFPRKWILYDTKLKGFSFKFHFDTKTALVALDLEDVPIAIGMEFQIKYWEKLVALKSILLDDFLPEAIFEEAYILENGKEISRIFVSLDQKVSIHNKNTWRDVMVFFNEKMTLFEAFFEEYKDVIEN
ncbi:DUF4268 domain-containing protein [Mariniflexile sp.]|uniref:DUF4268 domain-containing protein n=1 Tax=Mariniflexile sp. TaxID=1979402 RepID=UPI004047F2E4